MIVFGLVLVAAALGAGVFALDEGGDPVHLHLHWFTIATNGTAMFVAGAASVLVLVLGLWSVRVGVRHARRRRREIKGLRHQAHEASASMPAVTTEEPATRPVALPRRQDADDYFESAPRD